MSQATLNTYLVQVERLGRLKRTHLKTFACIFTATAWAKAHYAHEAQVRLRIQRVALAPAAHAAQEVQA